MSGHPPRILITARREMRKARRIQFSGEAHHSLLLSLGALPIMVPAFEDVTAHIDTLVEWCDGILLTEGGDVGPTRRGSGDETSIGLVELDDGKDALDFALLERALADDLPFLGICRGAQLLNVARGGHLHRDISRDVAGAIRHLSHDDYDGYRHPMEIEPSTLLSDIYGESEIRVTSVHHQANSTTGDGLVVSGRSPDGLAEAIEDPGRRFAVGVQFHPERQIKEHPGHRALYAAFVDAARGG